MSDNFNIHENDSIDEIMKKSTLFYEQEFPELKDMNLYDDIKISIGSNMYNDKLLYEGLIVTRDIYTTRNILEKTFGFNDDNLKLNVNRNIFILILKEFDKITIINNWQKLLQTIDNLGWYPSQINYSMNHNMDNVGYSFNKLKQIYDIDNGDSPYSLVFIKFEAKFDIEDINIPNKIYHVSPSYYRDKILRHGLIPKSKNKLSIHPDRIYFTTNKSDAITLIPKLKKYIPIKTKQELNKQGKEIEYDLYEINTKNIQNSRWFKDPNLTFTGIYCLMNILPSNIKLIGTIKN